MSDVQTVHGRSIDYALGKVGYCFEINGSYVSGYYTRQYFDEQAAWAFVDALRDRQVFVRYQPNSPQISVLREQDQLNWGFEHPYTTGNYKLIEIIKRVL